MRKEGEKELRGTQWMPDYEHPLERWWRPLVAVGNWLAGRPNEARVIDRWWRRRTLYEAGIFFTASLIMHFANRFSFPDSDDWLLVAIVAAGVLLAVRYVNRWECRQRGADPPSKTTPD